jgi:hypothetical protein
MTKTTTPMIIMSTTLSFWLFDTTSFVVVRILFVVWLLVVSVFAFRLLVVGFVGFIVVGLLVVGFVGFIVVGLLVVGFVDFIVVGLLVVGLLVVGLLVVGLLVVGFSVVFCCGVKTSQAVPSLFIT